mmetsp:Transcript_5689/g.8505  ORF Transcript_5689/g.8505 Transcript_5689/m.8505 type:complete len:520 (+) Transcript_5689:43-1602(+)
MVNIKLKWNKLTFDCEVTGNVDDLKKRILELTNVPVDRQKLMAKGAWIGTLKDGDHQSLSKLKENATVMLMGTAEVISKPADSEKVVFVEDMSVDELARHGVLTPAGMVNLGNTCYMNSTLECFRYMPELRQALTNVPPEIGNLATNFVQTCNDLDRSGVSIPPFSFVHHLRRNYPQFAETSTSSGGQLGGYMQQDAEEFFNTLVAEIQSSLNNLPSDARRAEENRFTSLLELQMQETLTCAESELEAPVIKTEAVNKLVCNIQNSIDHMHDSIKLGLEGTIEKHSAVLNRNALWKKTQRISSLPRYLCFQFLRFFWKPTPESRDHRGVKCKIMRAVTFPETIDVFDFCNEELQQTLKANRLQADKAFEASLGLGTKPAATSSSETSSSNSVPETAVPSDMDPDEYRALQEALQLSMDTSPTTSSSITSSSTSPLGNCLPADFTGLYELHSLVTHKGRSADSGHYMGWVRQGPSSDLWWCFNDEKVVADVRTEDVLRLCGGGDRDIAYLTFYRYKLPKK